jgi:hypothetical protein
MHFGVESAEEKTFIYSASGLSHGNKTNEQKFFASFFQKRSAFLGASSRHQI